MRRLPVYFLLDVSESMVGEPIEEINQGMRVIIEDLQVDPYALETVFVSVIAFAGQTQCLLPLTELTQFKAPKLEIGSGTSLGRALDFLVSELDHSIVKTTHEIKGDWKPIVFLFTDGVPTDDVTAAVKKWNSTWRAKANLVAISIGRHADVNTLGKLTDNVLRLSEMDQSSFRDFFKWVTASIKTSSVSVSEYSSDELKLPPTSGINLEKVNPNEMYKKVDENYVVLSAKCSTTKEMYLVKFAKEQDDSAEPDDSAELYGDTMPGMFNLVGAYKIDEDAYNRLSDKSDNRRTVDSTLLNGYPSCPCCGAEMSMIRCGKCTQLSCHKDPDVVTACPWCGNKGKLVFVDSIDYTRQKG